MLRAPEMPEKCLASAAQKLQSFWGEGDRGVTEILRSNNKYRICREVGHQVSRKQGGLDQRPSEEQFLLINLRELQ